MDHPLQNELVLSALFSYFSLKDLASCRLVSKKWNNEANSYVKKKIKIEFFGYEMKRVKTFLKDLEKTNDFPFAKFGFQIWDTESFRSRFLSLPRDSEQFFLICGSNIKHLRLGYNDFLETVTVARFRKWFLTSVPNLNTLELSGLSFRIVPAKSIFDPEDSSGNDKFYKLRELIISDSYGEEDLNADNQNQIQNPATSTRYNETILRDLLRMCPFLESLTLRTAETVIRSSLISSTLLGLPELARDYLTKLYLLCIINDAGLKKIMECRFRLNCLMIEILDHDVQTETLELLLASQRLTLRKLVLGEPASVDRPPGPLPQNQDNPLKFPCMLKLECLTIARPGVSRQIVFRPNIYEQSFPNLANLDFGVTLNYFEDFFPNNFGRNETIRFLRLPDGFADANLMEVILKDFPNLRSLSLSCPYDEVMKQIWMSGTHLEDLEIYNISSVEADSIFTGIPTKICEWIIDDEAYFRVNDNFFEVVGRQKSISDMRNLQRLFIEFEPCPELSYFVTDITVYLGISDLNELTSLTVRNSLITPNCQDWISENLSLVHLEIS